MGLNEYDDMITTGKVAGGGDTYSDLLSEADNSKRSELQQSLFSASKTEPDRHAEVLKLAQRTSLPPAVVERNFDTISKSDALRSTDYDSLIAQAPKTTDWLKDPENSAVASDDIGNLRQHEDALKEFGFLETMYRSLNVGLSQLYAGIYRIPALAYDVAAIPQNVLVKAIGRPDLQVRAPDWMTNSAYDEVAKAYQVPEMGESIVGHIRKGEIKRAGRTLAAQFIANAPNQVALLAGAISGLEVPALIGAGAIQATSVQKQAKDAGADPLASTIDAMTQGTIEAAFEKIGTFGLFKHWEGAIAKSFGKQTSREVMKDFAKTLFVTAAGEGNEEFLTQLAQDFSDYATGVNPDALKGTFQRALDAGLIGAASGVAMTGPSAITSGVVRSNLVLQAERQKSLYTAMGNTAEASKVRQRLPEKHRQFVENLVKGGPVENVYIAPDKIEQYFQSKNIDPAEQMKNVGALDSYLEAKQTGTDVKIPLANWTDKVVGTEYYQGLADDIKFSPESMSVNEAKAADEANRAAIEREASIQPVEGEKQASRIGDIITQQLKAAGQDAKTAETNAQLYEAAFKAIGRRTGLSPMEVFNRYGLKITAPQDVAEPQGQSYSQGQEIQPFVNSVDAIAFGKANRGDQNAITALETKMSDLDARIEAEPDFNKKFALTFERQFYREARDAAQGILEQSSISTLQDEGKRLGDKAISNFGETTDVAKAGFVLPDGRMVDFAHGGDVRLYQHNDIEQIYPESQRRDALGDFMWKTGAARIGGYDDISGRNFYIESWGPLTGDQLRQISDYLATTKVANATLEVVDGTSRPVRHKILSEPTGEDVSKFFNGTSLFQAAYHGTPHKVEKFSLHKIGTGQGAQSYGWGLYFAGSKEVAESYRAQLAGEMVIKNFRFGDFQAVRNEEFLDYGPKSSKTEDTVRASIIEDVLIDQAGVEAAFAAGGNEGAKKHILAIVDDKISTYGQEYPEGVPAAQRFRDIIEKQGVKIEAEKPGYVYQVDIPEDKEYLHWDKTIGSQTEAIKKIALSITPESLGFKKIKVKEGSVTGTGWIRPEEPNKTFFFSKSFGKSSQTGKDFYDNLTMALGTYEASSRYLSKKGLPGIRYLDQGSRENARAEKITKDGKSVWQVKDLQGKSLGEFKSEQQANDRIAEHGYTSGTSNYVIFDDKLVKIIEHQQRTGGAARGRIVFGNGRQFNIELLKDADHSTFIHESGHFLLELMGDLAQDKDAAKNLKDDYQSILKWLGVESRDQIKTDQHEQFARGFEAYLMEGKAPSGALRTAFARFKVWLIAVYRRIQTLNVKLTDDVRGVFDRMLATSDEIDAANRDLGFTPLFTDPKKMGMSDEMADKYLNATFWASQTAKDDLDRKLLAEFDRERQAWYRDRRTEIRAEIESQVAQERVYQAIDRLREGAEFNGTVFKLSREGIDETMLKRLPARVVVPKAKGGGLNVHVAAEILGYESGEALLDNLANSPKKEDLIEQRTDARMRELYPDTLLNGTLPQEALNAAHNEKRAQLMRLELEILAATDMPVLKEMIRRVARRVPTDQDIREQAEAAIGRRTLRELSPYQFQLAETKAAKEAGEALARGDFDGAFNAKRRELLNHELYRSAVDAQEQIEKAKELYKKVAKADEKLAKTRDIDLVNAARAILAQYGLTKTDETPLFYVEQIRKYDPDVYDTVVELIQSATQAAGDYKSITFNDFVSLRDAVDALWHLSRTSQQIVIDKRIMDKEAVKTELMARLEEIATNGERPGYERAVTTWDKVKMGLLGIRSALRRVESWVDAVDSGNPNGVFRRFMWNPVSESVTDYRIAKNKVIQRYLEIVKGVESSLVRQEINATELGYRFKDKAELLGAILHTGNESNLSKLIRGRGWGDVDEMGNVNLSRWNDFVQRMWAENVLTKADYDFAQSVWDLLEELKPQAQKAHRDMYGFYFNEITAQPIETPFGTYRGGYVPAVVDPFTAPDAAIRQEKEMLEKSNNSFMFPTAGRGFTKKRVESYARPLSFDLRYVPGHIDKVLRFIHIEPRIKEVGRLVMDREFRNALDGFDPTVGGDMLVPWLQRSAQQKVTMASQGWGGRAADTFFRELRTRTGLQIMTLNVVNTLQQFTGLSISAVKVKPRFLRNALWSYVRAPKMTTQQVSEKSAFMSTRTTTQAMEIQQTIDDLLLNPTKYEKARDFARKHGYFLQAATQNVVDVVSWSGAYAEAIEQGMSEQDAVRRADSVVRLTQGTFNAEDVSRFETGTPFVRAFTMFYSYFNMQANLLGSEFSMIARDLGLRKGAGRGLYVYTLGFMVPAVLSELLVRAMSGHFDEDDDDNYLDDLMAGFFGGQFRTATAMFPFVGPAILAGVNAMNDKWYDDRISTSPSVAMIESAVKSPVSVYKAIQGSGSARGAIRDALTAIGLLSGLPVAPLSRPIGYLADVNAGEAQPEGPIDFVRGLITGKKGG